MRKILLLFFAATITMCGVAQNTFFPTKEGSAQAYARKDKNGKVEEYTRQTIKKVDVSGNDMTISYVVESLDKNQKPLDPPVETPFKINIKDDVVYLDMSEMFAKQQIDQQMQMEITGVPMELPNNMQVGQTLKDANMLMTIDMGIMKMKTDIQLSNIKCLAIEDVTTAAGTFKCHKITQTATTTMMKQKIVATTLTWYALGVGVVKTENYDDKNKLQNSMELVSVN